MEVTNSLMRKKVKRTSKLWQNLVQLIAVRRLKASQYKP